MGRKAIALAFVVAASGAGVATAGDSLQLQAGTKLTAAPWQALSHARSLRLRAAAFTRGHIETPKALAFTVTSSKPERVRLFWSVYCEGFENDVIFNQQGTVTMAAPFSGYPPMLSDPARCYLTLRATPTLRARVQVTTLAY